jgi:ABC-2 type transport system ATP-binding protein
MEALSYRGVQKTFGDVKAVKPLDLDVPPGEIFGLLGPNGAGKSTLIRMTMGIYLPDGGTISVLGQARSGTVSAALGYLPEERGLYTKMKVGELLRFFGCLRGLSSAEASRRASWGLKRLGLEKWEGNKVDELSKGMQQKIQLLVAIQHKPKIAILDEPFSGLDPVNTELFMEVLDELIADGTTVVLSTHQMEQVEKLCHAIALINKGEVVLRGKVGDIRREYGTRAVSVAFADGAELAEAQFADLAETTVLMPNEARFRLRPEAHAGKILKRLLDLGVKVSRFEEAQASMHDIFVQVVTGRDSSDAAAQGGSHAN